MIAIKNLKKYYKIKHGDTVKALDGVSLSLPRTGMVFILGKSGSGKSTLLNIIGGLDKPDSGELTVNNEPIHNFSTADIDYYRNTYVGFIFQNYNLIDELTVEQNIALALQLQKKRSTTDDVKSVLNTVGIEELGKRRPNTLSGGQQQRVAIARTLIKNPSVILADEPTGALDSETGRDILATLKSLSSNRLVLIVSHDRETAEAYGDRIIEMKDGKIVTDSGTDTITSSVQPSGNTELIKSGLPFSRALQLGASGLSRHIIRLIIMLFISIIAFTMFGAASTAMFYDVKHSTADAVADSGYNAAFLSKESWSDYDNTILEDNRPVSTMKSSGTESAFFGKSEVNELNKKIEKTGLNFAGVFMIRDEILSPWTGTPLNKASFYYNIYLQLTGRRSEVADYYKSDINWFSDCGDAFLKKAFGEDCLLAGSYPTALNEIAISEYHYDLFQKYGYYDFETQENIEISAPADLIGKSLNFRTQYLQPTIAGVYRVGNIDKRYDVLKSVDNETKRDETLELKAEYDRILENSFHTTAYVSEDFYENYGSKRKNSIPIEVKMGRAELNLSSNKQRPNESRYYPNIIPHTNLAAISGLKIFPYGDDVTSLNDNQCIISLSDLVSMATKLSNTQKPGEDQVYAKTHEEFSQALGRLEISKPSESNKSPNREDIETIYQAFKEDWDEYINRKISSYDSFSNYYYGKENNTLEIAGVAYSESFSKFNEEFFYVLTPRFIKQNTSNWNFTEITRESKYKAPSDERYPFILSTTDNSRNETYGIFELQTRNTDNDVSYKWKNELYSATIRFKSYFDTYGLPFFITALILGGFAALLFGNFIAVSISSRKRELGILRALGARKIDIFKIFLTESSIISMICFVLSAILSSVACVVVNGLIMSQIKFISVLSFGIWNVFILLGLIIGIAFISTAIPIWINSKKQPVENMRAL